MNEKLHKTELNILIGFLILKGKNKKLTCHLEMPKTIFDVQSEFNQKDLKKNFFLTFSSFSLFV